VIEPHEIEQLAETVSFIVLLKLAREASTAEELRAATLAFYDVLGVKLIDDVVQAHNHDRMVGLHALNLGRGLAIGRQRHRLWT
jgi:hypothetical protein